MLRTKLLIPFALIALAVLSACTPQEIAAWSAWHRSDPQAATEYAQLPAIQEALQNPVPAERVESMPADLCGDAQAWRVGAGLPDHFDYLAFRESNCRNDVRTYCCYGIYQLYWSLISRDHRMVPKIAACGVDSLDDIYGETADRRRNNTCVAKALYDVAGYSPWST